MNVSIWLMLGTAAVALVALRLAAASGRAPGAALRATVHGKSSYVDLQRLHDEWQAEMDKSHDPFGQT